MRRGPAGDLATIFVPQDNVRYPQFVEWAKNANPRLWKFGVSSDKRQGIWISYDTWDLRQIKTKKLGDIAAQAPSWDQIKDIYAASPAADTGGEA